MKTKTRWIATTLYGTFTRTSAREYRFCIARHDGWHQFSQTEAAARREFDYQNRKHPGRVEMVPVYKSQQGE